MAKQPPKPKRTYIELTASWGNDDSESSIKIAPSRWESIKDGGKFSKKSISYYEGEEEKVVWTFKDGLVSIDGEDGRQCILEEPIESLHVEKI